LFQSENEIMTLSSRLKKLEQSNRVLGVESIRRPDDVPEEIWLRAMELLADYSPAMMLDWHNLAFLIEWCCRVQPQGIEDFPEPVIDVVYRAMVEAETGELPSDRATWLRDELVRVAEMSEEELVEHHRVVETRPEDYLLPWPYSPFLLKQMGEHLTTWSMYHAARLSRGEITEAEHAAELAKFLPVVTRADHEKAVRTLFEMSLEPNIPARCAKMYAAIDTEHATDAAKPEA